MKSTKTMIEPKKRTSLSLETFYHKYDTYCCPSCSLLPEILYFSESNGKIKLKCKKHGENFLDIQEYLEKMIKWEKTSEIKFKNKCPKHKEQYSFYCIECGENICNLCLNDLKHQEHSKYEIDSLRPNNYEIFLLKNKIEMYLEKKEELLMKIKSLEEKITFYDVLIHSFESQSPNFLLNLNLKHLLYGENLNLNEIKNTKNIKSESKKDRFDNFVKKNLLKSTEGLDKLVLINKNIDNELIEELVKGIDENNTIFQILRFDKQIQSPNDLIKLKNIKYIKLRGNKISSLNFLSGKDFPFLEVLSFNDNELNSIDDLKYINCQVLL